MATVSGATNVIELSDSDGSYGTPPATSAQHVASGEFVRRSTRHRKASTRFSPDDDVVVPVKKNVASPSSKVKKNERTSPPRAPRQSGNVRMRSSSHNSDTSSDHMELIDPQVLITYIEKFSVKIRPGKFGVNMPIGPDEFVVVDAVDYLRNLGFSDFEEKEEDEEEFEEGERHETAFMIANRVKEEVLFESQAAVKSEDEDEESDDSEEKHQEVNFWDGNMRGKLEQSSQSQTQDFSSADSVSQKSTEGSIDVEALDPTAFKLYGSNVMVKRPSKKSLKAQSKSEWDDDEDGNGGRRNFHNFMEKQRRMDLASHFSKLYTIVFSVDAEGSGSRKAPKVKILSGAIAMIKKLKKDQDFLAARLKSLQQKKTARLELLENLTKMYEAKKVGMDKIGPNQQVKNYLDSL